jgi:hypothetical protein
MGIFLIDPYAAGAAFAAFLRRRRGFAAPAVFLAAFLRRFGAAFLAAFLRRFGAAFLAAFLRRFGAAFLAAFLRRFGAAFLAAAFLVVRFFDVFLAAATYFSCQLGSIRHRTC